MLDINIEFVKGLLLVTLEGKLNKSNVSSLKNNLLSIIKNGGIKYLMFNLNDCKLEENVDIFNECSKVIKNNCGKMYIYGLKNKNVINDNCYYIDNTKNYLRVFRELEC